MELCFANDPVIHGFVYTHMDDYNLIHLRTGTEN